MALEIRDYNYIRHTYGGHEMLFQISDEDLSGDPSYFGYVAENGAWIIQQRTTSTGAYRYAIGKSGYDTAITGAWATRATISGGYKYYHNL